MRTLQFPIKKVGTYVGTESIISYKSQHLCTYQSVSCCHPHRYYANKPVIQETINKFFDKKGNVHYWELNFLSRMEQIDKKCLYIERLNII